MMQYLNMSWLYIVASCIHQVYVRTTCSILHHCNMLCTDGRRILADPCQLHAPKSVDSICLCCTTMYSYTGSSFPALAPSALG